MPPPVNPAAPQRDWASLSDDASASQVGEDAKLVVPAVIVCQSEVDE